MALNLNFSLVLSNDNGATVAMRDTTADYGEGSNPDYADVLQTRMLCGIWAEQEAATELTEGDELELYRQYQLTSSSSTVYDNKTLTLGSYFIPFVSGLTVSSGDTFIETGVYSQPITAATYLPTSSQNVFNMTDGYWGLDETDGIFPSQVYFLQYEIYGATTPDPLTNVTNETQYIVTGTGSATAVYDGNTYRVGEVFIATDNGAVTFTGDGNLNILLASKNRYYSFVFTLEYRFFLLLLAQDCPTNQPNATMTQILLGLQKLLWSNYTQWISISDATETIAWIDNQLSSLENLSA